MSSNISHPTEKSVNSLLDEIGEIKQVLRETSQQLLRIERRVKAAFPNVVEARPNARTQQKAQLDEDSARRIIRDLKEKVSKGEQIEGNLRKYSVKPHLQTLARVLGMTNTKLPPKDELVRRISTRLRQSVSVTTGMHEGAEPEVSR